VIVHKRREEVNGPAAGLLAAEDDARRNEPQVKTNTTKQRPVQPKPLRPHITPDDRFEEGMRLLARALRIWELKRRWPGP